MRATQRYVVAMVVGALALTACGGSDANDANDAGDTASPAAATDGETTTSSSGGDLAYASHDDLVAAAQAESGDFKVYMSTQEESIAEIADGFQALYPNLNVDITEQSGSDAQRILLEVQADASDYDVLYLSQEVYADFLPFLEEIDMLAMAQAGVLDIHEEMINPAYPWTAAFGSGMAAAAYNPTLLPEDLVPHAWEDYLNPELKGRMFAADIEPVNLATLVPAWGEEKVKEFAGQILAQDPIWARGETQAITAMGAGEFPLHFMSNYHSSWRAMQKSPDTINISIVEPIPVRLTQAQGIHEGTDNPASSILFLEYLASPEVQSVLDELEPRQSSIYAEGSEVAKLIEGKELSVWSWEYFPKMQGYLDMILDEWGFPTAEITKE